MVSGKTGAFSLRTSFQVGEFPVREIEPQLIADIPSAFLEVTKVDGISAFTQGDERERRDGFGGVVLGQGEGFEALDEPDEESLVLLVLVENGETDLRERAGGVEAHDIVAQGEETLVQICAREGISAPFFGEDVLGKAKRLGGEIEFGFGFFDPLCADGNPPHGRRKNGEYFIVIFIIDGL